MARDFEDTVSKVADRIARGHVLLSERIRAGRRRSISVGPHRTAISTRRQYGMIVLPAPIDEPDLRTYDGPKRAAREFVRLVGVAEAREALAREARKHGG